LGGEAIAAMQNAAVAVEKMLKFLPPDPIAVTTKALAGGGQPVNPPRATKGGGKKK
jgi:hypothetical protein